MSRPDDEHSSSEAESGHHEVDERTTDSEDQDRYDSMYDFGDEAAAPVEESSEGVPHKEDPSPVARILDALEAFGVYLVVASVGLAVLGILAIAVGIQPYGNVLLTLAIVGGIVSMLFGMLAAVRYKAHEDDEKPQHPEHG